MSSFSKLGLWKKELRRMHQQQLVLLQDTAHDVHIHVFFFRELEEVHLRVHQLVDIRVLM